MVRAALRAGQRPTAVIMRDPWFGHRDPFTHLPLEGEDRDEWITWDYLLIEALQIIEDNTDRNGLLAWEIASERVDVLAIKTTDKFQASIDRQTKGTKDKGYQPAPGETWYPELELRGGKMPTYSDWIHGRIDEYDDEEDELDDDGTID